MTIKVIDVLERKDGSALPVLPATRVSTDTANFNNNLSATDDTVQKALETLDEVAGGDGTLVSKTAGEALGGQRVVVVGASGKVFYADNTNTDHANIVFGVTTGAVILDALVSIRTGGEFSEVSWSWALNQPIFLNGTTGQLSQTAPVTGFAQIVGFPISATSIFIKIDRPIILI